MAPTQTHYDLLDAFGREGCPVCRLALRTVERYVESISYEYVNDLAFRADVEPAWGFCNEHAQLWLTKAHVLGTSLIYGAILRHIADELRSLKPSQRDGFLAGVVSILGSRNGNGTDAPCTLLRPEGRCPICRARADEEAVAIAVLVEQLAEPGFRDRYAASHGLCLPHLRQALCGAGSDVVFAALKDAALAGFAELESHLREIVRKHDYRFRDEPAGAERGAAERAVRWVSGSPGIEDR